VRAGGLRREWLYVTRSTRFYAIAIETFEKRRFVKWEIREILFSVFQSIPRSTAHALFASQNYHSSSVMKSRSFSFRSFFPGVCSRPILVMSSAPCFLNASSYGK
jgi:hypothetical protein